MDPVACRHAYESLRKEDTLCSDPIYRVLSGWSSMEVFDLFLRDRGKFPVAALGSGLINAVYRFYKGYSSGVAAGVDVFSGTLNKSTTTIQGVEGLAVGLDEAIKMSGNTIWAGVSYNYDFEG